MNIFVREAGLAGALAALLLSGCAEQSPVSPTVAQQAPSAAPPPALAVLNEWCAGNTDWNPPLRVVDKLVEKDGKYYVMHGSSRMQVEYAKATEWMPGMNGPDLLPVTISGNELHYTSKDGWRYVRTVLSASKTHIAASRSIYYNTWDDTCLPASG